MKMQKRVLNCVGPFIGLPMLGEIFDGRKYGYATTWLVLPLALTVAWIFWPRERLGNEGLLSIVLAPFILWAIAVAYPAVSLAPMIRNESSRNRFVLNVTGPLVAAAGLGDLVIDRRYAYMYALMLLPFAFVSFQLASFIVSYSWIFAGGFITLMCVMILAYVGSAILPLARDGYRWARKVSKGPRSSPSE